MRITGLYIYPVKGCRGIALDEAKLVDTGIAYDRAWMVIDPKGLFITQRDEAGLARIEARFNGQHLALASDGHGGIATPVDHQGEKRDVRVWHSNGIADDAGDDVAAWLTDVLKRPARLVRTGSAWARTRETDIGERPLSFADGYPFLMISEASLADLNTRLPAPIPMARFRPNIVVDGIAAYAEDQLETATRGSVTLRGAKPCVRCSVTTTDQLTGARDRGSEPLRTLARYRNDRVLRGVIFGMNVLIDNGVGEALRIGDELSASFLARPPQADEQP